MMGRGGSEVVGAAGDFVEDRLDEGGDPNRALEGGDGLVEGGIASARAEGGVIVGVGGGGERGGGAADAPDGAAQGIAGSVELGGEAGHRTSSSSRHSAVRFGVWGGMSGKDASAR